MHTINISQPVFTTTHGQLGKIYKENKTHKNIKYHDINTKETAMGINA